MSLWLADDAVALPIKATTFFIDCTYICFFLLFLLNRGAFQVEYTVLERPFYFLDIEPVHVLADFDLVWEYLR